MKRHHSPDGDDFQAKRGKGDGKGDRGGQQGSKGGGKSCGLHNAKRHAFKVLCSDHLAANLIGKGGAVRVQMEEETGSSVWISKRDQLFPKPEMRVLILHADDPRSVLAGLEAVVPRIIEVADRDRASGNLKCEYLGSEEGEYQFHMALPVLIRGKLIGKQGENINELRKKTGAKIFFENEPYNGHHATRVIGTPDQIRATMVSLNDLVQDVAAGSGGESEDFHRWVTSWPSSSDAASERRGGRDAPRDRSAPRRDARDQDRGRDHEQRSRSSPPGRDREREGGRDSGQRNRSPPRVPRGEPVQLRGNARYEDRSPARDYNSGPPSLLRDPRFSSLVDMPDAPALESIEALVRRLPAGAVDLAHAVSCDLPRDLLQAVVDDETRRFIERKTSTEIQFKDAGKDKEGEYTQIMFTGPLLSTYLAHFLVMQRVHEHNARKEEEKGDEDEELRVADLKAQVARLQDQLRSAGSTGKGGGGNYSRPAGGGRR